MSDTILLVEDNPHIMEINREALLTEDYTVLEAPDGRTCMAQLAAHDVDLIVLDIMLPDSDGLALCRRIRQQYDTPVLFLTALDENAQIIQGLRAGGDDYLTKPYDIGVLLARVEARLRSSRHRKRHVRRGDLKLDTLSMIACCGGRDLLLTQKEFLLLLILVRDADRLIPKEELYQSVWGGSAGADHNALYTTVSRLNKKLGAASSMLRVVLQRGSGYTLEEQ